ncbi:peptidase A4 family-domain-containing protein [Phanerochaete sordida]|uniref:Peptidase A4 family-domain-containing protein n=1 Tax=Phanerochaete sordida TaxID=48140 RepID=A0A9P3GNM0_9APHY|nr:peptidase A4 family-domain-containing protein [Phanerochaete sordida]
MRLSTVLISSLVAGSVLAAPSNLKRRESRIARRGSPRQHASQHDDTAPENNPTWAGAVINAPQGTFTSVSASFTVPAPQEPAGLTGFHAASAWVGIDGDSCQNAILQTGADFHINGGRMSYNAWYEWWPADSVYLGSALPVSAGDVLYLNVTAFSPTRGVFTITNTNTGATSTKKLASKHALCMQDADWIVEDYGDTAVPFANFGDVVFTGATALTADGGVQGLAEAYLMNIEQNDVVLTSVAVDGDSLTVSYVDGGDGGDE